MLLILLSAEVCRKIIELIHVLTLELSLRIGLHLCRVGHSLSLHQVILIVAQCELLEFLLLLRHRVRRLDRMFVAEPGILRLRSLGRPYVHLL